MSCEINNIASNQFDLTSLFGQIQDQFSAIPTQILLVISEVSNNSLQSKKYFLNSLSDFHWEYADSKFRTQVWMDKNSIHGNGIAYFTFQRVVLRISTPKMKYCHKLFVYWTSRCLRELLPPNKMEIRIK